MKGGKAGLSMGVALVVLAGVAAGGGQLIVSAGLDQTVTQGDPVYLDGGGTHVSGGDLATVRWSIETPDGRTISPDCPTCEVTQFRPSETGTYEVTLTARSEAGERGSDTLYVIVEAPPATPTPTPTPSGGPNGTRGGYPTPTPGAETPTPASTPTPGNRTPTPTESPGSDGGPSESNTEDNSGCWVRYSEAGDNRPNEDGICDVHGDLETIERMSDGRDGLQFENEGLANQYSEVRRNSDGSVTIPVNVYNSEVENLYNNFQETGKATNGDYDGQSEDSMPMSSGANTGGAGPTGSYNSGPPTNNRPTSGTNSGGNPGGPPPVDSCRSPCGHNS